jgi:hypothetical protein
MSLMSSDQATMQVDLAEFDALRAEIQTFLNLQCAFLGVAVAFIGALIPVAAGQQEEMRRWLVTGTPLPFAILAILYADVAARIGRAANYIQTGLRPRIVAQTAPDVLGWEQYVHKHDPNSRLLWVTDKIRYFIFFLPAIFTYGVSFWAPVSPAAWDLFFRYVNGIALLGALIVVLRSERVLKEIVSTPKN